MIFWFLYLNILLLSISLLCFFLIKQNFINILLCIELLFLIINPNFVIFSIILDDIIGIFFCPIISTIAAAESVIGLGLLISFYRLKYYKLSIKLINFLKH